MSDAIPIQTLSEDKVRAALRDALDSATPVRAVSDFVSGVDWSGMEKADAAVVSLLGELEQLTTDVDERIVSPPTFLDRVSRLAPAESAEVAR